MNAQNKQIVSANAIKFPNAEHMWFWFLYSRSVKHGYVPTDRHTSRRVCELLDVELMVTKLYYAGKLNDEHLSVMKKYGDRRRAPHQHIWAENHDAGVWRDAMAIIEDTAREYGWIE